MALFWKLAVLSFTFLLFISFTSGDCGIDCACTACLGDGEGCVCDVGDLVVNEVHLDNHGNVRWVEVVNVGQTRSLNGVQLKVGGNDVLTIREGTLKSGQAIVLYNRYNPGEGQCNAANPTLSKSTGSIFLAGSWSQRASSIGEKVQLVEADGTPLVSYVIQNFPIQTLSPDVFGPSTSAVSCTPGARSTGTPFVRISINEVMIDAGLNDYNHDNVTGELSTLPAHGMQDGYIEIVNQECYNVDIGGFHICITCPSVCEPVYDGSNNLLGCPPLQAPTCTPFHLFPPNTVLPPGGAILVFAGYVGIRGGEGGGVTFSMEESADFGYSIVQIASLPSATMETYSVELDSRRKHEVYFNAQTLGLQKLLPILPCVVCSPDDPTCNADSDQPLLLVGSNPLISYSVMNGEVTQATAELPVLDIHSGISFAHIPSETETLFSLSCVSSDMCGCDPSCATPGYQIDGSVFVQPKIVGYKTVSNAENTCLSPGEIVTVTTILSNVGDQSAYHVTFLDNPFEHSTLIVGSVTVTGSSCSAVSESSVVYGNTEGDDSVMVHLPQLCICNSNDVVVQYKVLVTSSFDCSSSLVVGTQGEITWAYGPEPTSSVTSSSPTFTPLDAPTVVEFCGLAQLYLSSNTFFPSSAVPGQTQVGQVTVTNNGHFPACGVALSVSSEILSCSPSDENPSTVAPSATSVLSFSCEVPQPYPCAVSTPAVDVALISSNNDGSTSPLTGFLEVEVFDNVTSLLTATCSTPNEDGCCPPGATISFSGWIQNTGTRDICDVSYQLDHIDQYGQIVLGSAVAQYCDIQIGNNYGDENGPVFFVCPHIESGGVEFIDFEILLDSPAPSTSPSTILTNALLSYTSDGLIHTSGVSTSDVGILRNPTMMCLTAYPSLSLNKSCSALPPVHKWEPATYSQYHLVLENSGTQTVDVSVSDPLSPYHIFVGTTTPQCSYDLESNSVNCMFYSVTPNVPINIAYSVNLNPESPLGDVEETFATAISSFGVDEQITVESNVPSCDVTQTSVLSLSSVLNTSTVSAEEDILVTLTVFNSIEDGSNQAIEGFFLSDNPSSCSIVGDLILSPPSGWLILLKDFSGFVVNGPSLVGGQSATLSYVCRAPESFRWGEQYVSSNAVAMIGNDPMIRASASARIVAATDLVLTIESDVSTAEGGSYVHYSVRIVNFGTRDAHEVRLYDVISPHVPLEAPEPYLCGNSSEYFITVSSQEDSFTSCDYESLLGSSGLQLVEVPALRGCVDVNYFLKVSCPLEADVYNANNTVYASYIDIDAEIADWCQERRSTSADVTSSIGVTGSASISVTMASDVLSVPPNEKITYTVSIFNSGNRNVLHGVFDNQITDPYLTLDLGSIITDGVVTAGNSFSDYPNVLSVDLGVIAGTACGGLSLPRTITFVATVTGEPSGNVTNVCNQGTLSYYLHHIDDDDSSSNSSSPTSEKKERVVQSDVASHSDGEDYFVLVTNDPLSLPIDDATCTLIDHDPQFILTVSSTPDELTAGTVVTYTVLIQNDGIVVGSDLLYTADLDPNLELIQGSVTVPKGVQNLQNVIISGNRVQDTYVQVSIGTLGLADSFVLSFQARVADPYVPSSVVLPAVSRSSDMETYLKEKRDSIPPFGFSVSVNNVIGTTKKNYTSLVVIDPLVNVAPSIFVTKSADLASSTGLVPGQRIQYTISVSNLGNAIGYVYISDYPTSGFTCIGDSLTYLTGTVDTNRGVVLEGNNVGDSSVYVQVGLLAPYETATILFEAVVTDPFPCPDLVVKNQASYSEMYTNANGFSDDPTTPPIGDPTSTVVYASPFVSAFKSVVVKGAASITGDRASAGPGDVLVYSVDIQNDGNQAAFDVNVTDTLDPSVWLILPMYFNGSPLSSYLILDLDTNDYATEKTRSFRAMVGVVAGANTSTLKFEVKVSDELKASTISNQAVVSGSNFDTIASSSSSGSALDLPTSIDLNAQPDLDVILTWWVSNSTEVTPGSTLWYSITITNSAEASASAVNVTVKDVIDSSLVTLNLGTVTTTYGSVKEGNTVGDEDVVVSIPQIVAGDSVTVQYSVSLATVFPAFVNSISNEAIVSGNNFETVFSRDPQSKTVDGPTVTPVIASPEIVVTLSASANGLPVSSSNLIEVGGQYITTVVVKNVGDQEAADVLITASIDEFSTFVAGSVVTSNGVVKAGNYLGDKGPVTVSIGTLGVLQTSVTVSFTASVNSPFAGSSPYVNPSASVSSDNSNSVPAVAMFPVNAAPQISVRSTCDFCLSTGDRCNSLNPGEKLQVTAIITNSGNQNAFDVVFLSNPASPMIAVGQPFDVIPSSVALTLTSDVYSNGSIQINFKEITGGSTITFSYYLQMTNAVGGNGISQEIFVWNNDGDYSYQSLFSCASSASRQGVNGRRNMRPEPIVPLIRRGESCPPVFTSCPTSGFSPNVVDACGTASVTLKKDNDKNGVASTGDILLFNVTVYVQSSCSDLPSVTFTDTPDPLNTKLVSGTVHPTFGRVISGNKQNDGIVLIDMGKVPGNRQSSSVITFEVEVTGRVLGGQELLTNIGYLTVEYYGNYDVSDISPPFYFSTLASSASLMGFSFFTIFSLVLAMLLM